MLAHYAPTSVADYCRGYNEGGIIVNEEYQRNPGIWSAMARSFFIESILLEYPIPKIFLYSKTDLKTRTTVKEIVDGQQRTDALVRFYNGKYKLSAQIETEELRGLSYKQLPADYQGKFLNYSLPIDDFRGVTSVQIQDSFRRMNSSNVVLNDEEQRHAKFQGPFKWFIQRLCKEYSEAFRLVGVFSRRDLIRMTDTRVYAEIIHVLCHQFVTIKKTPIDNLYKQFDKTFVEEIHFSELSSIGLDRAIEFIAGAEPEFKRAFMLPTVALCYISQTFNLGILEKAIAAAPDIARDLQGQRFELSDLAEAVRDPSRARLALVPYAEACTKGTNVARARAIRFLYLMAAL
jgi:hypothetical protein